MITYSGTSSCFPGLQQHVTHGYLLTFKTSIRGFLNICIDSGFTFPSHFFLPFILSSFDNCLLTFLLFSLAFLSASLNSLSKKQLFIKPLEILLPWQAISHRNLQELWLNAKNLYKITTTKSWALVWEGLMKLRSYWQLMASIAVGIGKEIKPC